MKNIFFIYLISLILLNVSYSMVYADKPVMRAVFSDPGASYRFNDSNSCNSDPAFNLYKKLGYNTFIEFIPAPSPEDWVKDQFVVRPEVRSNLVKKIKDQKKRIENAGLLYCPFYGEWGWGDKIAHIDARGGATVYREVNIINNYYGREVYPRLLKTTDGWFDTSITATWNREMDSCILNYNGPSNGCTRIVMSTKELKRQFKDLLPAHLITGQCYDITYQINLNNAKLVVGDYFRFYFFREYLKGQKPDPKKVPIGELEDPRTETREVFSKTYQVTSVIPGGYILNNGIEVKPVTTLQERIWIEPGIGCGGGVCGFDTLVRFDFELLTANKSKDAAMHFNLQIKPVDPRTIVTNRQWETSKDYPNIVKAYPNERLRETKAEYEVKGTTIQQRFYLDSVPQGGVLKKIRGHFLPWNKDNGWASHTQNTVDPLSPVADLVNLEMLRIIYEGLDSVPPQYFCISSDEIPVFRRDYLNMKSGKAATIYNSISNGEYFARIVQEQILRYKKVFGSRANSTTFIVCGDMILPFGIGYKCIAERIEDEDALSYFEKSMKNDQLAISIWAYDYTGVPKCSPCIPKEFTLQNTAFMQENVKRVTKHNLKYIAWYATDGKMSDLKSINGKIDNDVKHIQHEIDMARSWCDIINMNSDGFNGYMFCGWSPFVKTNRWNGLYPFAWFGWKNPYARDFPKDWKIVSKKIRGDNDQPVFELLEKEISPW